MNESDSGFFSEELPLISSDFVEVTLIHDSPQGYCRLYKAKRMGKWFVLKCLKETYADNPTYQVLLRKEFEIGYPLAHPHVVQTVGWEQLPPYGECIVLEYIDGMTLRDYAQKYPKEREEWMRVIQELCAALSYIHGKQTVHRDLKPENILITHHGHHVKLIDFGFADVDNFAVLKGPAGTARYAAPEQWQEGRCADARTDIYALGVILEELTTDITIRSVARQCSSERMDNRPADASFIPRLIKRKRLKSLYGRIGAMVVALLLLIVYGYHSLPVPSIDKEEVKPDTISVSQAPASKQPEASALPQQLKTVPVPQKTSQESTIFPKIDELFGEHQKAKEPSGVYQNRWLLKDYVESEMDKVLIPLMYGISQAKGLEEWQTLVWTECQEGSLLPRLRWKVEAGYMNFIQNHPLAEIDAEGYRPLMETQLLEHYEAIRHFYRPLFEVKERELNGAEADNLPLQERLSQQLTVLIVNRLHPYLHHCDTMQHDSSLRHITMEEWKKEIRTDAANWLENSLSPHDTRYRQCLSMVEKTIESVCREVHAGRIRLAEKEARFRVMK